MARRRYKPVESRLLRTQQRSQTTFSEMLRSADRHAREQANRRGTRRGTKSIRAAIAASHDMEEEWESSEWPKRLLRWLMALALLPFCWITSWTFLSQFSHAAMHRGFWHAPEFWYFTTGALLMVGWFWSGLPQKAFLYLYVLGHELTHAICVLLFRGKVSDFHVSVDGGYITTNKTNLIIALSPYFVPFWSAVVAVVYLAVRWFVTPTQEWDRAFYAVMGATWTFHMVWTLWMIPRDQPDLKENGTFLSLVIIYLANVLVLAALLCVAAPHPLGAAKEFGLEWLRHALTWGDSLLRWSLDGITRLRETWYL